MKIIKAIGIGIVGLAVVLVLVGFLLPGQTHVERSVQIDASPARIFPYVNSLREFNRWSPWYGLDPSARYTYEGPERGVGARMSWASTDPAVGSGSMAIVGSEPRKRVDTALDFGAQGTAQAYFLLEESGAGTRVTWAFDTDHGNNLFSRYIGLMMDGLVGQPYQEGLTKLKQLVEG